MNREKRRVGAGLLACLALATAGAPAVAAADTTITYNTANGHYLETEGDDLFSNFKGVIPGDDIAQVVRLRVKQQAGQSASIFLHADAPDPAGKAFLSQLTLTVKEGKKVLFDAPADKTVGLEGQVMLGSYTGAAEEELDLELKVPESLGNDWQNTAGAVNWVFTAQSGPAALPTASPLPPTATPLPPTGTVTAHSIHTVSAGQPSAVAFARAHLPQTGDAAHPGLWGAGALGALAMLAVLWRRHKL